MKKLVLTVAISLGALISLPVQAAPLASGTSALQAKVRPEAQQVYHCRYWSDGWNCGWGNLREEHSRYWSHRRNGSQRSEGYRDSEGYRGSEGREESGYEGFGHLRTWSHRRNGSDNMEEGHSRHMSHQRTESWKKRF
jgi:hypothetical protein